MQQLHEKIADMNSRYYDLRGKIVKAERRIAILTERGEMWEQYNQYKPIHKQLEMCIRDSSCIVNANSHTPLCLFHAFLTLATLSVMDRNDTPTF